MPREGGTLCEVPWVGDQDDTDLSSWGIARKVGYQPIPKDWSSRRCPQASPHRPLAQCHSRSHVATFLGALCCGHTDQGPGRKDPWLGSRRDASQITPSMSPGRRNPMTPQSIGVCSFPGVRPGTLKAGRGWGV